MIAALGAEADHDGPFTHMIEVLRAEADADLPGSESERMWRRELRNAEELEKNPLSEPYPDRATRAPAAFIPDALGFLASVIADKRTHRAARAAAARNLLREAGVAL